MDPPAPPAPPHPTLLFPFYCSEIQTFMCLGYIQLISYKRYLRVYSRSMETIYLSLRAQVGSCGYLFPEIPAYVIYITKNMMNVYYSDFHLIYITKNMMNVYYSEFH